MTKIPCPWCSAPFIPSKPGGSEQRFCCPGHKRLYERAERAFGKHIAATLPPGGLKAWAEQNGVSPPRAAPTEAPSTPDNPGVRQ